MLGLRDFRDAVAEGFEDWLFQLKAAHKYKFVCVPLYLVGYRSSSGAMSSDMLQMARSGVLAMRETSDGRYAVVCSG